MTPRDLLRSGASLMGVFLVTVGVVALAEAAAEYLLPGSGRWDVPYPRLQAGPLVVILGQPVLFILVGILLIRQSHWIAGLCLRGESGEDGESQDTGDATPLSQGSVRGLAFAIVGSTAVLLMLLRVLQVAVERPGFGDLGFAQALPHLCVGYLLVALGVMVGPVRVLRIVRGLRPGPALWDPAAMAVQRMKRLGLSGLGVWFLILAFSRLVEGVSMSAWSWDYHDRMDLAVVVTSGPIAWILLRAAGRDGGLGSAASWIGFEIAAVLVILTNVNSAAWLVSMLSFTDEGRLVGNWAHWSVRGGEGIAVAVSLASAIALLVCVHRLRKRSAPA